MRYAIATGLFALTLGAAACSNAPEPIDAAETPDGTTYVLTVEGMSCAENCAPRVKECLESIEGVKRVEVTFEDKRAVVVMEAGRTLTVEAADKSFNNEGYFVSEIAEKTAREPDAAPAESAGS